MFLFPPSAFNWTGSYTDKNGNIVDVSYVATGRWSCDKTVSYENNAVGSSEVRVYNIQRTTKRQDGYTFTWTIKKGVCEASDDFKVYNNSFDLQEYSNFVVCSDRAQLHGEDPGANTAGIPYRGEWTAVEPQSVVDHPEGLPIRVEILLISCSSRIFDSQCCWVIWE